MIKNNITKIILAVVLVLIIIFLFFKTSKAGDYSVVYLTTGEVYIGKLTTFPNLSLKDMYLLQVTQDASDPTKRDFNLAPVKDALWAPSSIEFVRDNVVFYGPLLPESDIAKTLASQQK